MALKFTQYHHGEKSNCTDVRTLRELRGKVINRYRNTSTIYWTSTRRSTPTRPATLTFMNRLDLEELMDSVRKYF